MKKNMENEMEFVSTKWYVGISVSEKSGDYVILVVCSVMTVALAGLCWGCSLWKPQLIRLRRDFMLGFVVQHTRVVFGS